MTDLESHRKERARMIEDLNIRHDIIARALDSWTTKDSSISKAQLSEFPIMQWVHVDKKIKIRKRMCLFGDILVFDTVMRPGAEFAKHLHPDCIEHVDVIEGELIDLIDNVSYGPGDKLVVEAGTYHIPIALEHTVIRVYFK